MDLPGARLDSPRRYRRGLRYRPPAPCIEHFSASAMWADPGDTPDAARAHLWKYFHDSANLDPAA